jgi:hypothetical protein
MENSPKVDVLPLQVRGVENRGYRNAYRKLCSTSLPVRRVKTSLWPSYRTGKKIFAHLLTRQIESKHIKVAGNTFGRDKLERFQCAAGEALALSVTRSLDSSK